MANTRMIAKLAHNANHVGVLQKNKATVAIVIGKGAKGFRAQGNLRVQCAS